jgi:7,8-dihydro-6-hydroxymethylpterin dimethyltransferase
VNVTGTAYCPICLVQSTGVIDVARYVWLERKCSQHGRVRTQLYQEPSFLEAAQRMSAQRSGAQEVCLVLEVTDRCEVGCSTCSASSTPGGAEPTSIDLLAWVRMAKESFGSNLTVALSGGEPLARRDLPQLLDALHSEASRLVLITSGHGLESDPGLVAELSRRTAFLEIYLQLDSLRDSTLLKVRGPVVTSSLREQRIKTLVDAGLRVTTVCVIAEALDEVPELVTTVREWGAIGITFQPLRLVGRFPFGAESASIFTTLDAIQAAALRACGTDLTPMPHPTQPFDLSFTWVGDDAECEDVSYFCQAGKQPGFRVATYSYWDETNYFEPLTAHQSYFFYTVRKPDLIVPLNQRYFDPTGRFLLGQGGVQLARFRSTRLDG